MPANRSTIAWFSDLSLGDLDQVGGKNASLGEMVRNLTSAGVRVPDGFATTADAYRQFLSDSGLTEMINAELVALDTDDVAQLAAVGRRIREAVTRQPLPANLENDIRAAYSRLAGDSPNTYGDVQSFAVRSSATAEDLPDASFAGQQETFLNVRGIEAILEAIKQVFASLYNDRAIAYRVHHRFEHEAVGISAGVQQMVRSDIGASGVMFTMDTESGFPDAVFITSSYGLGEGVVQGAVNPDEFYVYKPALRAGRPAILKRGVGGKAIKMVYSTDTEVGRTTEFVDVDHADRSRLSLSDADVTDLAQRRLPSRSITADRWTSNGKIGTGAVRVLTSIADMNLFHPGEVLVADMTDPDWEPIMKRAAAIITNRRGRTCMQPSSRGSSGFRQSWVRVRQPANCSMAR